MRVSILEGVFLGNSGNVRRYYPMNMQPVLGKNGVSDGYLRTAPGLTAYATGPGADRGSVIWNGNHYRVMGSKLVQVLGGTVPTVQVLGDVGNDGLPVTFDYGMDRLAIASAGNLFYWLNFNLIQVTDPSLGTVVDMAWIDGYYMSTDGTFLVVTQLQDPTKIIPLNYGSAEADPDPIVAVKRVRDEIYAVGANTIENFQNTGGSGFPFTRNPGGLIPKGACGTKAVTYFLDTLAFVGAGRQEELSVYLAGYGTVESISTPEIDRQIQLLTLAQRAAIEMEAMVLFGEQRLLIHLPTKTLVYHRQASLAAQKPVWSQLAAGVNADQAYPARHFSFSGINWLGGTPGGQVAMYDETVQTQLGQPTTAQFETEFLYNEGRGAILKSAELVGTPGLAPPGLTPSAFLSWTQDGHVWSQERVISLGAAGRFLKRLQWRPKVRLRQLMGLRFRLPDAAVASFAALEVEAEPLNV